MDRLCGELHASQHRYTQLQQDTIMREQRLEQAQLPIVQAVHEALVDTASSLRSLHDQMGWCEHGANTAELTGIDPPRVHLLTCRCSRRSARLDAAAQQCSALPGAYRATAADSGGHSISAGIRSTQTRSRFWAVAGSCMSERCRCCITGAHVLPHLEGQAPPAML